MAILVARLNYQMDYDYDQEQWDLFCGLFDLFDVLNFDD